MLQKCNQLIWNCCPKDIFISKKIVEMAVNSATTNYNDECFFFSINYVLDSFFQVFQLEGTFLQWRGRLTDIVINTLQNYVGMEIKQNDITEMRNSIIATLYHCTTFQYEEPHHLFCSKVKNSWCKWQSHITTGKQTKIEFAS